MSTSVIDPVRHRHRTSSPDDPLTTTRTRFVADDLLALLDGRVPAVRITDFLDAVTLTHLRSQFVGRTDHGPLATDARFRRIGHAFSECVTDADRDRYFADARNHLDELRRLAAPHTYPADAIRILLDDIWPTGSTLFRHHRQPFFAGVARYQQGGVDLEPHTDNISRNLPAGSDQVVQRQLSINVYLDVPESGGELQIWDAYPDEADYRERIGDRTYGVGRETVGDPRWVVHPEPGEAIIIDPRRIHAVAPSADRPRVTVGVFVGVVSETSPLVVWS